MTECIFCSIKTERLISENEFFFVIRDLYPVTDLHTLIIPKQHVESFFELSSDKQSFFLNILNKQKEVLQIEDSTISGFNIGINDGKDAGQTVMHCHIHLIPRRYGDMNDPRGGVRGVIPSRQSY